MVAGTSDQLPQKTLTPSAQRPYQYPLKSWSCLGKQNEWKCLIEPGSHIGVVGICWILTLAQGALWLHTSLLWVFAACDSLFSCLTLLTVWLCLRFVRSYHPIRQVESVARPPVIVVEFDPQITSGGRYNFWKRFPTELSKQHGCFCPTNKRKKEKRRDEDRWRVSEKKRRKRRQKEREE